MSLVFDIQDFTAKAGLHTHELSEILTKDQVIVYPEEESVPKWDWPQWPAWKRRIVQGVLDKVWEIDSILQEIYDGAEELDFLEEYLPKLEKYIEDGLNEEPYDDEGYCDDVGEFIFYLENYDRELGVEDETAIKVIPIIAELHPEWIFDTNGDYCYVMTREYAKANNCEIPENGNFVYH